MAGPGVVGMAVGDHGALDRRAPDRYGSRPACSTGRRELASGCLADASRIYRRLRAPIFTRFIQNMPARLFLSSGDLMADRRFEFARDLQLKGDLPAAADLLLQAIELAPNFVSAWFTLGEIREQLGERDAAIAAFRKARAADPDDRHGASLRLMRLGAEPLAGDAAGLCAGAVRSICAAVRGRAGRRSRLSRAGAVVQGGAVGARRRPQAGLLQARHRSRLRHRACGARPLPRRSIISSASICRRA